MRTDYESAYSWQGFHIPRYMMGGIKRYVEKGIPPGHFLTAVICNDLQEAVGRADDYNLKNLPAYAVYFYNRVPSKCWGSREKMEAWMAQGGMEGDPAFQYEEEDDNDEQRAADTSV